MRAYDIIKSKRDGKELSKDEIDYMIEGYTNNVIEDYHMSALLMAIFLNGMNNKETLDLTKAMARSGDLLDLSKIKGVKVDKHSTGGVGDTTTLILGPMIAACDMPFVKMSGRGLGHTGGTLDKLDSIEGLNTNLSMEDLIDNSNDIKLCITGQTANIAPADRKIYALRDVTSTIDNLSLIASSVMSKKLAMGSDVIVLDVKFGKGAFMKTKEEAIDLSKIMVDIGHGANKDTVALVTAMNQPLGNNIGNSLEVKEAIETLRCESLDSDLYKVTLALGEEILLLTKKAANRSEARNMLEKTIRDGLAYKKFLDMVEKQGGNIEQIENMDLLPKTSTIHEVISEKEGYVVDLDAEKIGKNSLALGAGRESMDDTIDLASGIVLNKRLGDYVEKGDILAYIHSDDVKIALDVKDNIKEIYKINKEEAVEEKLIYALVTKDGIKYY